jgi:hypothetical protein
MSSLKKTREKQYFLNTTHNGHKIPEIQSTKTKKFEKSLTFLKSP